MRALVTAVFAAAAIALAPAHAGAGDAGVAPTMASVGGGSYRPVFGPAVTVAPFRLDRLPVTNGDFLAFVRARPEWRRDRVARVVAEADYLSHWRGPETLGPAVDADQPVVLVSWFAARAYCSARGRRLPTEAEWELAAGASRTQTDASKDPAWRAEVLALDVRTLPARLPRVGAGAPNVWGIHDLHGLVWEWVADFQSAALALDGNPDRLRFCGGGGGGAGDAGDFAAFERLAMRSALRASYTTKSLGFRCAADAAPPAASTLDRADARYGRRVPPSPRRRAVPFTAPTRGAEPS